MTIAYVLMALILIGVITVVILQLRNNSNKNDVYLNNLLDKKNREIEKSIGQLNQHMGDRMNDFNNSMNDKQEALRKTLSDGIMQQENRLHTFSIQSTQQLEQIRGSVQNSLESIQRDNNKKLDEMRAVVDEKLQKTLESKMNDSFKLVSERLEQVYKGLGEMNVLAKGVGDLKKVLTNVKSRGILGEVQLGAILKEILSPEQYDENVRVKPKAQDVVEFAVKMPGEDGTFVYLPIDSKFPGDTYQALVEAYDNGDKALVEEKAKALIRRLNDEAKDISTKYINPPETTSFAIMFLPFEGLYAEAVNRGMVEQLQNKYKVNIAGPSTMAALLNSLQMGFNTLAIRKRSVEIEKVLQAVRTEFDKFETVLLATQKKLENANNDLDKLVGVRTRQIKSKLKNVSKLEDQNEVDKLLEVNYIEE